MLTLNDTMLEEVSDGTNRNITTTKINVSLFSFNKQKNTAAIINTGSANGRDGFVNNGISQGNNVGPM